MSEHLKSGRQAIRLLFFFIISMALTRSLMLLFSPNNIFVSPNGQEIVLFIIFFTFIFRFSLGGYRILSQDVEIEIRYSRVIVDAFIFVAQSLLFYIYALTYGDIYNTSIMIVLICGIDVFWLAFMAVVREIGSSTFIQWLIHDLIFMFGLTYVIKSGFVHISYFYLILAFISIIAGFIDIYFNRKFYFSYSVNGLKIFIVGPYGDNQPKEVIEKNVNKARDIGKLVALRGHTPFIPHTMLHGWETDGRFTADHIKKIDHEWLSYCDAIYYIGSSKGADEEKAIAQHDGIRIFTSIDEIPDLTKKNNIQCKYQKEGGKCSL